MSPLQGKETSSIGTVRPSFSDVGTNSPDTRLQKCAGFRGGMEKMVLRAARHFKAVYMVDLPAFNTRGLSCKDMKDAIVEWVNSSRVSNCFTRCGRRERMGGRFAIRMLKKQFVEPCKCFGSTTEADWFLKAGEAVTAELPEGFLAFCDKEVKKMFPVGWDRGYISQIARCAPNTSSCTESPASKGGARAVVNLDEYLAAVTGESDGNPDLDAFRPLAYKEVFTSGKMRPLVVTPRHYNYLRPLHKLIYARVKRQKWCLMGPPSAAKFKRAGFTWRDKILSGDYASATDNLDLRVSRHILAAILDSATIVPTEVKQRALHTLTPVVAAFRKNGTIRREVIVGRGQMMGSLLSFPLLCVYNRLCTLFSLGRVPMLINGDDLVAQTPDAEPWFRTLPQVGLTPERSKTGYEAARVEINSTPFRVTKNRLADAAPVLRTRVLAPKTRTCVVGGQLPAFVGSLRGKMRLRAEDLFLREMRPIIIKGLSRGIPLESMGFGELEIPALLRNGIFNIAVRFAKQLPHKTRLPDLSTQLFATNGEPIEYESNLAHAITRPTKRTLYETRNELSKRYLDLDRKEEFGDLFESFDLSNVTGARNVERWWKVLDANSPSPRAAPTLSARDLRLLGIGGAPLAPPSQQASRCLFYGDVLSRKQFVRRTMSLIQSRAPKQHVLSLGWWQKLPAVVRWGIKSGLTADDTALVPNKPPPPPLPHRNLVAGYAWINFQTVE